MSTLINFSKSFSFFSKTIFCTLFAFAVLGSLSVMAEKSTEQASIAQVRVSINSASAEELAAMLTGVGEKKAEAIIEFRTKNGKFTTIEDLALVKGIGEATIEKNRAKLTL